MPFEALNLMNLKQVAKITSNLKTEGESERKTYIAPPFDSNMEHNLKKTGI